MSLISKALDIARDIGVEILDPNDVNLDQAEKIGTGGYATVYKATGKQLGFGYGVPRRAQSYAVKVFKSTSESAMKEIIGEIRAAPPLTACKENPIDLKLPSSLFTGAGTSDHCKDQDQYDICPVGAPDLSEVCKISSSIDCEKVIVEMRKLIGAFLYNGNVALVTEYFNLRSLYDLIYGRPEITLGNETMVELTPLVTLDVILDILEQIDTLQNPNEKDRLPMGHLDLKPENIALYFQDRLRASVIDFGNMNSLETWMTDENGVFTGTPAYVPPEAHYGSGSELVDAYSVGVILYEMLEKERPFQRNADYLEALAMCDALSSGNNVKLNDVDDPSDIIANILGTIDCPGEFLPFDPAISDVLQDSDVDARIENDQNYWSNYHKLNRIIDLRIRALCEKLLALNKSERISVREALIEVREIKLQAAEISKKHMKIPIEVVKAHDGLGVLRYHDQVVNPQSNSDTTAHPATTRQDGEQNASPSITQVAPPGDTSFGETNEANI